MTSFQSGSIPLGEPAPWFDAKTIAGASLNLGVQAGRWIALCFLNAMKDAETIKVLAQLLAQADLFDEDHLVFYGVLTEPPLEATQLAAVSHRALGFITDYDGTISRLYGAMNAPQLIVLDPMLRPICNFAFGKGETPPETMQKFLRDLPRVDDFAGVPLTAPALIVPRVFEPEFCNFLIDLYEKNGGVDSGFMLDQNGKTATVIHYDLKRRNDLVIEDLEVRQMMRARIVRRLVPAIERFFQYRPTRMDRYLVSC